MFYRWEIDEIGISFWKICENWFGEEKENKIFAVISTQFTQLDVT